MNYIKKLEQTIPQPAQVSLVLANARIHSRQITSGQTAQDKKHQMAMIFSLMKTTYIFVKPFVLTTGKLDNIYLPQNLTRLYLYDSIYKNAKRLIFFERLSNSICIFLTCQMSKSSNLHEEHTEIFSDKHTIKTSTLALFSAARSNSYSNSWSSSLACLVLQAKWIQYQSTTIYA